MSAKDVQFFFTLREQIKLQHWQTTSYARHKATDDVIHSLDENIDKYVEVQMGKQGRPKVTPKTGSVSYKNLSESAIVTFIREAAKYLITVLVKPLKPTDTDLFNIRDEMLADLNQLLYLFTLH